MYKQYIDSIFTWIVTRPCDRMAEETRTTPITDHGKKMVKEIRNACVAVERGERVRRNCNVFNLAMENVV
jgi:hypothetical protein